MIKLKKAIAIIAATMPGLMALATSASGQTYTPTNWVNDPFNPDTNYVLAGSNSVSPSFTSIGIDRSTLYGNSPIGGTLRLVNPGDTLACTGRVILAGDVNADGDMQFRIGLYYQGTNTTDNNWLGYMVGNATGQYGETTAGLYVRNNPNPSPYSSGSPGSAMRPPCGTNTYKPGWGAATYDFSLSITMLPASAQLVAWKMAGVSPNVYIYAGAYTNNFPLTVPPAFDQVGLMGGRELFGSITNTDSISFQDVKVALSKHPESQ